MWHHVKWKEDYTYIYIYIYKSKKASTFFPTEPTRHVTTKNLRPFIKYMMCPLKMATRFGRHTWKMGANNGISSGAGFELSRI